MKSKKLEILKDLEIGGRVAEEEENLEKYFVETNQWLQIYSGKIDIIYGAKGAGKSALYALLHKKESELFDNNVLISPAENVRGATVFRNLVTQPPPSEFSFICLWKIYCLIIIGKSLREYGIYNDKTRALINALEKTKLLPQDASPTNMFGSLLRYFKGWINKDIKAVEHELVFDPSTGIPSFKRKVEFREEEVQQSLQEIPVEELLGIADSSLSEAKITIWLLFDRLDVAFADSQALERNALRALFRAYSDMKLFTNISLKIFVRDDIWRRISSGGFTEASHITKTTHITWAEESLVNLLILRLLNNSSIADYYNIDASEIKQDYNKQKEFLYRIMPNQIDTGKNPPTHTWMFSRTQDSSKKTAPRELIHLMECVKKEQIKRYERGEEETQGENLFDRKAFKKALEEVSTVRYEQTLLAEYPEMTEYLDKLTNKKSEHTVPSLMRIWGVKKDAALTVCKKLSEIGFFEMRGGEESPTFWVPFLYRSALDLSQGKSE